MSAPPIEAGRRACAMPRGRQTTTDRHRFALLGVGIDNLDIDHAVATLRAIFGGGRRSTLFFVNAHTLDIAARDPAYREVLNRADLVFPDGTGVRWAARLGGVRLRANLNGTDLIPALLQAADGDRRGVYLLGAKAELAARTAQVLRRRYPGWTIAGHHHGYLGTGETAEIVAAINAAAPHLLLVAMGNPVQERWIAANRAALAAPLVAGVGGLFAYLAGDYRRAPRIFRRFGLEWLFVLLTQPRKWHRYLVGATRFLLAAWRARSPARSSP